MNYPFDFRPAEFGASERGLKSVAPPPFFERAQCIMIKTLFAGLFSKKFVIFSVVNYGVF